MRHCPNPVQSPRCFEVVPSQALRPSCGNSLIQLQLCGSPFLSAQLSPLQPPARRHPALSHPADRLTGSGPSSLTRAWGHLQAENGGLTLFACGPSGLSVLHCLTPNVYHMFHFFSPLPSCFGGRVNLVLVSSSWLKAETLMFDISKLPW